MDAANPLMNIRHSLHALAQPLAAVTGLVDLLLLEMDEEDEMFPEIRLISEQLEKVLRIIEEIRRIAREATASERADILELAPLPKTT
jgi:signal transduction histidine kinase